MEMYMMKLMKLRMLNSSKYTLLSTPFLLYLKVILIIHDLFYNVPHRNLDHSSLLQGITMLHYVDEIMLTGPNKQERAITLKFLIKHVHIQGLEINLDMVAHACNDSTEEEETRRSLEVTGKLLLLNQSVPISVRYSENEE